jgi:glycosyltransferase involved in cell wall biosynthesis
VRVLLYYSAPEWTGSARVFIAAGRGLAARGYQVTFVCPGGGSVEARAAAEGCDVIPLDAGGLLPARSWHLQRILTQRFVETAFVHTESEQLAMAIAMRMAGRGGIVRRVPPGARPHTGRATRLALRLASGGFVCTSAADAELVRDVPHARAPVVAELGVDIQRYDELRAAPAPSLGVAPGARVVVCVCDANQRPRAASVLRTMALLAPRHPDLHLVMLGPGPGHEDVRMHAAALGLTRRVSCLGERDDDLAVLRAAELGWVAADEDTAAYAALDFMAMRTPVVADRGTIAARYIADGITGATLTPDDTPAAAAIVAALLAQTAQRTTMGNAGRARVAREYTESAMLDRLQEAAEMGRDRSQWSG